MTARAAVLSLQLLAAALVALAAGSAADPAPERPQLDAQRRAIEAAHEQRLADCRGRFAVTACVDAAREDRRTALAPLREREHALDAAERARRSAQRRLAVEAKQRELSARPLPQEPTGAAAAAAAPTAPAVATNRPPREPMLPRGADGGDTELRLRDRGAEAAGHQREAAQRAEKRRQREAEGQVRRDRVVERQMERSLRGKTPEPLPLPASAAVR